MIDSVSAFRNGTGNLRDESRANGLNWCVDHRNDALKQSIEGFIHFGSNACEASTWRSSR